VELAITANLIVNFVAACSGPDYLDFVRPSLVPDLVHLVLVDFVRPNLVRPNLVLLPNLDSVVNLEKYSVLVVEFLGSFEANLEYFGFLDCLVPPVRNWSTDWRPPTVAAVGSDSHSSSGSLEVVDGYSNYLKSEASNFQYWLA